MTIVSIFLLLQESNYILIREMWLFDFFVHSSLYLISRGTDILKYFRDPWISGYRDSTVYNCVMTSSHFLFSDKTYEYWISDLRDHGN